MVEVWGDGINSSSKITVVREVKLLTGFETLRNAQSQHKFTPQTMAFSVQLMFLQQLEFLTEWGIFKHFRGNRPIVVPLWNAR